MLFRICFVFFLLNMCLIANAEDCSACKKKIDENSSYIKSSSGAFYCNKKCAESKLPACDVCGKKSSKYITAGDKTYCSRECGASAGPHCSVCKKALFGAKYLTAEKIYYCDKECFLKTKPKCLLCSEKSMEMSKVSGKDYCGKCGKLERCEACGFPSNGSKFEDGREICKSCQLSGVQDSAKANEIYLNVKKILLTKFNIETTEGLPFSLIDKTELLKIKGTASISDRGFYRQKEISSFKKTVDGFGKEISREKVDSTIGDRHIYILSYLPENHFRNVVAHELMHNWQMTNYPKLNNLQIEEGIAEYMAYLLNVDEKDTDLMQRKTENKDPIYGDGFRLVKEWDKGKGLEDIKAKLKELYK